MLALLPKSDLLPWPQVDQRRSERFPVELSVRYKVIHRRGAQTGEGKTVNMSSSGVLLTAELPPVPGQRVELSISWPAQLHGQCGLQLVASGRVIWCQGTRFAIQVHKHEFRTAGTKSLRPLARPEQTSLAGRPALLHLRYPSACPQGARPR